MSAGLPDAPAPVRALPVSGVGALPSGCGLDGGRRGLGSDGASLPPLPPLATRYGGAPQSLTLKLPVTINKFFQPTEMAAQDFFQRWKQLSL